jgi:hypothetical protein
MSIEDKRDSTIAILDTVIALFIHLTSFLDRRNRFARGPPTPSRFTVAGIGSVFATQTVAIILQSPGSNIGIGAVAAGRLKLTVCRNERVGMIEGSCFRACEMEIIEVKTAISIYTEICSARGLQGC